MVLDGSLPFSASPSGGGMLPSDIRLGKYHNFNCYHGGARTPQAPEGEERNEGVRRKRLCPFSNYCISHLWSTGFLLMGDEDAPSTRGRGDE